MKYFKYEERDETWPGKYQLVENPEFEFGWDGEEGIYFNDIGFVKFLEEKYEEYLKQKSET